MLDVTFHFTLKTLYYNWVLNIRLSFVNEYDMTILLIIAINKLGFKY